MRHTVFLFGEAERGEFGVPIHLVTLAQLADVLGNPPPDSQGISFAVQALLFERDLIFYRVKEEGFSTHDYMLGLNFLEKRSPTNSLSAIAIPGVGDTEIIDALNPICTLHNTLLIVSEKDLFDYLISPKAI